MRTRGHKIVTVKLKRKKGETTQELGARAMKKLEAAALKAKLWVWLLLLGFSFAAKADPTIHLIDQVNFYTNSTGGVSVGEYPKLAWSNANYNFTLIWTIVSNGVTGIQFTNTHALPAGSTPTASIVGYIGHAAIIELGLPSGYDGTNFITVFDPTNSIVSSRKILTYSTNNITWGTSNYLARVNGLSDFTASFGQLGGTSFTPGTNVFGQLVGSYNGTTGWFVISNTFRTTNTISISAVGAGGGLGNAQLYTIDHLELLGRTNYLYGQEIQFDEPVQKSDAATKNYVDNQVGALKNATFVLSTDTNNVVHYAYYGGGQTMQFDLWYQFIGIPINSLVLDGSTYTNVLMDIYQTNLTSSFTIQSSTNLNLGSVGFTTFTNYTLSTNTGVVTFTIPIYDSEPMRFWRAISGSKSGVTASTPLQMNAGAIFYRTNPWTAVELTNKGGFAPWLSNYTKVWYSVNSNNVIRNIP